MPRLDFTRSDIHVKGKKQKKETVNWSIVTVNGSESTPGGVDGSDLTFLVANLQDYLRRVHPQAGGEKKKRRKASKERILAAKTVLHFIVNKLGELDFDTYDTAKSVLEPQETGPAKTILKQLTDLDASAPDYVGKAQGRLNIFLDAVDLIERYLNPNVKNVPTITETGKGPKASVSTVYVIFNKAQHQKENAKKESKRIQGRKDALIKKLTSELNKQKDLVAKGAGELDEASEEKRRYHEEVIKLEQSAVEAKEAGRAEVLTELLSAQSEHAEAIKALEERMRAVEEEKGTLQEEVVSLRSNIKDLDAAAEANDLTIRELNLEKASSTTLKRGLEARVRVAEEGAEKSRADLKAEQHKFSVERSKADSTLQEKIAEIASLKRKVEEKDELVAALQRDIGIFTTNSHVAKRDDDGSDDELNREISEAAMKTQKEMIDRLSKQLDTKTKEVRSLKNINQKLTDKVSAKDEFITAAVNKNQNLEAVNEELLAENANYKSNNVSLKRENGILRSAISTLFNWIASKTGYTQSIPSVDASVKKIQETVGFIGVFVPAKKPTRKVARQRSINDQPPVNPRAVAISAYPEPVTAADMGEASQPKPGIADQVKQKWGSMWHSNKPDSNKSAGDVSAAGPTLKG